jgi:hypothetical protein
MELSEFLVRAKINTYAGSGEGGEIILEDGSKELNYEIGEWKYRDRYFGFNPFIGEEIVWKNGKAAWGMNYYGGIVSDKVVARRLYQFLQKAMRLVEVKRPFRGPVCFQEGEWDYKDESIGTVDKFYGTEAIYFQKEKVYELKYHGGAVAK